jgi:aminopeptidase N
MPRMRPGPIDLALASALLVACSSDAPASTETTSPTPTTTTTTSTAAGGAGGSGGSAPAGGAGGDYGGGGAAVHPGELVGDVVRYDLALDLDTRVLASRLFVDVASPEGTCFTVPCGPAASQVTWDEAPATSVSSANGALDACGQGIGLGDTLRLGATTTVPKGISIGLDVGFATRKDKAGGTFTYLLSWVGGCSKFGPCDPDPSRLVTMTMDVAHAGPGVALCAGVRTETKTGTHCEMPGATRAPTYSAYFAAHDTLWQKKPLVSAAGVDVVFYDVPGGTVADAVDGASLGTFLGWITDLLGPFPYGPELRYATAPTVWLGFEHPANILIQDEVASAQGAYAKPAVHVAMHELVHQWSGDRSTIATGEDFVWKEATAEYLTYVFEDEHRPEGEAAASLAYWDAISLQSAHYPRPTDDPPPEVKSFYGDVYGPGPMTLYVQLESLFGRKLVLAGIKAFLADPGARSVNDLRKALAGAVGVDLAPYFDAWIFGKGAPEWPTLDVTTDAANGEVTVTVTQKNASGRVYGGLVEVLVKGASTSATASVSFGADPKDPTAKATVKVDEPVVSTVVDPRHRFVARVVGEPKVALPLRRVYVL